MTKFVDRKDKFEKNQLLAKPTLHEFNESLRSTIRTLDQNYNQTKTKFISHLRNGHHLRPSKELPANYNAAASLKLIEIPMHGPLKASTVILHEQTQKQTYQTIAK